MLKDKDKNKDEYHLENISKEQSQKLMTLETFDQSDEKTWRVQQKDKDKACHVGVLWNFWNFRQLKTLQYLFKDVLMSFKNFHKF